MATVDAQIISFAVRGDQLAQLQRAGVSAEDFIDDYQLAWKYIVKCFREHKKTPSKSVFQSRFPDIELPKPKERDLPILLSQLRKRRKYMELLNRVDKMIDGMRSPDDVDDAIQQLQSDLNELGGIATNGKRSHLVDLFSAETNETILEELQRRRSGKVVGIATGLKRFDSLAGGLQRQKMVTIIGRPGLGKSWLDLLFVANAVVAGERVMLYPLEMTLFETAARLYTLFSQKMFGATKVLKNYDVTMGNVKRKDVVRFLHFMEDKFKGQLYVADVAQLSDPYTNERIEAEVSIHRPSMFWVDYLTLMASKGTSMAEDHTAVRRLSNGVKNTAMRQNVVGGCSAQVNRAAMTSDVFLPRLENIAYGDAIGQDADQVFSINRSKKNLFYALVKNRGGVEFGKTKVKFDPNIGVIEEEPDQENQEGEGK